MCFFFLIPVHWPHSFSAFGSQSVGVDSCVYVCVRLCETARRAAIRHCKVESKPQGGDPTALWVQNGHSPLTSAHVRITASCWLTTTSKQNSFINIYIYIYNFIALSASVQQETHTQHSSVLGEAYLNIISFSVTSHASLSYFQLPLLHKFLSVPLPLNSFPPPPPHCTNTDKQAPGKHPE